MRKNLEAISNHSTKHHCNWSGRPVAVNGERLLELVQKNPGVRELEEELECSLTTIALHSRYLEKIWRYGAWIPHEFSAHQLQMRQDACMDFLTSRRNMPRLENLVTDDEEWVF